MVNLDQLEKMGKSQLGNTLGWESLRKRNLLFDTQQVLSNINEHTLVRFSRSVSVRTLGLRKAVVSI